MNREQFSGSWITPLSHINPERGDVLYRSTVSDPSFYHEGIYIGNRMVVHVMKKKWKTIVALDPFEEFEYNMPVKIKHLEGLPFTKEEIAQRAEKEIGKRWKFDRCFNNCEHFTNLMAFGVSKSYQCDMMFKNIDKELKLHKDDELSSVIYSFIYGYLSSRGKNVQTYREKYE